MVRRRYELTDGEWSIIEPLLPNKPRGVPRVDDRRVLNGILWRFRTGLRRPATTASSAGAKLGCGTGCSPQFQLSLKARS
jgi:transposase